MMNIHSNHSPVVNYSRREERCYRNVLSLIFGEDLHQKFGPSFSNDKLGFPFQEITSFGRFEVHVLQNPTAEKFRQNFEACRPDFVCLRGNLGHRDAAVGSAVAGDLEMHTFEDLAALFDFALPTTVYLEFPDTEKLAEAIHNKGVPHVIYWKSPFFQNAASYFSHALISVFRSSYSHIWDTFQFAHACFRVYCEQNDISILTDDGKINENALPCLVGESPEIVIPPGTEAGGENVDFPVDTLPFVKIHDDDVQARFLICGRPHQKDTRLLEALEDGLNSLVNIEIRGSKLQNRVSAPPPALQMETSRGVVTMRCDLSTCSSTYISFLVSGSAQTCFDDQVLDSHLKNEIVENRLVQALKDTELCKSHLRRSVSLAGGAIVFEVVMMLPSWTSQVLRQLAQDSFYKSFVALGVAGIQGLAVSSFEKEDADRLLFSRKPEETYVPTRRSILPLWLKPPLPHRKTLESAHLKRERSNNFLEFENFGSEATLEKLNPGFTEVSLLNSSMDHSHFDRKSKIAAMRPVPRMNPRKVRQLPGIVNTDGINGVQCKAIFPIVPTRHTLGISAIPRRKTISSSTQVKQALPLNPLPLKKHGCGRCPIRHCSEGEFLKDVIQFLILRGHTRLIPQGGLPEFPDAILNAKRLDLYNLYREVVSRGGFHVGNGINWKGQVFSKMQNYTTTNRMTGVGNTLKRHYETYLLEYELAHDDVDGECCLLCHSSAVGDWVNCGICGEWAHFGCDKRLGLAAFKDYAKTAGLEYICPHCSATSSSKKLHRITVRE